MNGRHILLGALSASLAGTPAAAQAQVTQLGVSPAELIQRERQVVLCLRVLGVGGEQLLVDRMRLGDQIEARTLLALLVVETGRVLVDLRQVAEDARFIGPLAEERLVDRLAARELLGGVRAVGEGTAGGGRNPAP